MKRPRRLMLAVAVSVAATLLAACGSDATTTADDSSEPAAADAFPVTIEHQYGETTIDEAPERIVTVGYKEQDDLLALGIVPVGVSEWIELGGTHPAIAPWSEDALGDAEPPVAMERAEDIDFETIASLQPDLILAVYSGIEADEYDTLSKIAPVVAQPTEYGAWRVPWDVQAEIVAKAVGRTDDMAEIIQDSRAAAAALVAEHPELEGLSAVATSVGDQTNFGMYGVDDPRSVLLTDLGLEISEDAAELAGDEWWLTLSAEQLGVLDADVIVWLTNDEESIVEMPIYQTLRAAEEGRSVFIADTDQVRPPYSFITAASYPRLVELLLPRIVAAADGDPATPTAE